MTIRPGDVIAILGRALTTLSANATSSATTLSVADADAVTAERRVCIGTELVYVTAANVSSAWSGATNYALGALVNYTSAGVTTFWRSLQAGNLNHTPAEGSWWTASSETLTVTRGERSLAASHTSGDSVLAVEATFSVITASRVGGLCAPVRATERLLVSPHRVDVASGSVAAVAQAGSIVAGSYQDDAGDYVDAERDGLAIRSRLGLVICRRSEGGHWELGVREV